MAAPQQQQQQSGSGGTAMEQLRQFRFVSTVRPLPWQLVRNLDIARARTHAPDLQQVKSLTSELCDVAIDEQVLGLVGKTLVPPATSVQASQVAQAALTAPPSTSNADLVQLTHALQLSLQFALHSQACLRSQFRSQQQSLSVQQVASQTLANLESKLETAQATVTALKEENRKLHEEIAEKQRRSRDDNETIEKLKKQVQAFQDTYGNADPQSLLAGLPTNTAPQGSGEAGGKSRRHHRRHSRRHSNRHHRRSTSSSSSSSLDGDREKNGELPKSGEKKPPKYVDWASFASLMLAQRQNEILSARQPQGAPISQAVASPELAPAPSEVPPCATTKVTAATAPVAAETAVDTSSTPKVKEFTRLAHLETAVAEQEKVGSKIVDQLVSLQKEHQQGMQSMSKQLTTVCTDLQKDIREVQSNTEQGLQGLKKEVTVLSSRQDTLEDQQNRQRSQLSAMQHLGAQSTSGVFTKPPLTPTSPKGDSDYPVGGGGGQPASTTAAKKPGAMDSSLFGEMNVSVGGSEGVSVGGRGGGGGTSSHSPMTMQCEFCHLDFPEWQFARHVNSCAQKLHEMQEAGEDPTAAHPSRCVHCNRVIPAGSRSSDLAEACTVRCPHCRQQIPCYDAKMHESECDLRFVTCKVCGGSVCAKLMKEHQQKCSKERPSSVAAPSTHSTTSEGAILPRKESELEKARRELQELLAEEAANAVEKRRGGSPGPGSPQSTTTTEPLD